MTTLGHLVTRGLISDDWAEALEPASAALTQAGAFLRAELAAGHSYLPASDDILAAFRRPLSDVRVLIVGQDPYPTPGHAMGLSFSVRADVWPLPPSLANIYRELRDDLGVEPPRHGDLSGWADQGVMLLNRVLTVRPGAPASHRGHGWEQFTQAALEAVVRRGGPLVAVLWGRDAHTLKPLLAGVPWVDSAHPSPLSAHRGFFGSRPFSRVNALLASQGAAPIDWVPVSGTKSE